MTEIFKKAVAELNLDRSDWQLVKFGDVAIQQKQTIDRENTELTRYVKGEHMYSEDLHLREWGELKDEYLGPAFIRKFEEGDVLYGSRRTYLRKVVVAPFEGITSNTTFVIKANEDKIDKRLLPFIMLSEGFTQHSIENSKGSVNPYVNWKDLAGYEFLLPPIEKQADIVKLLCLADEVLQKDLKLKVATENHFQKNRNEIFSVDSYHPKSVFRNKLCKEKRVDRCMSEKMLNGIYKSKEFHGRGVRLINMGELFAYPIIRDEEMSLLDLTEKEKTQFLVEAGDLIFARRSLVIEGAGRCSFVEEHTSPMSFESSMIRVRFNAKSVNSKYVYHFLRSIEGRKRIRRIVGFTTVAGITGSDLAKVKIPTVGKDEEDKIAQYLDSFDDVILNCSMKINTTKKMQKSLINQVF